MVCPTALNGKQCTPRAHQKGEFAEEQRSHACDPKRSHHASPTAVSASLPQARHAAAATPAAAATSAALKTAMSRRLRCRMLAYVSLVELRLKKAGLGTRKGSSLCNVIWLISCGQRGGVAEEGKDGLVDRHSTGSTLGSSGNATRHRSARH